jgi:hypothetical protein
LKNASWLKSEIAVVKKKSTVGKRLFGGKIENDL